LWKVTRSTNPARASVEGATAALFAPSMPRLACLRACRGCPS
jgi:hypothetical protein